MSAVLSPARSSICCDSNAPEHLQAFRQAVRVTEFSVASGQEEWQLQLQSAADP